MALRWLVGSLASLSTLTMAAASVPMLEAQYESRNTSSNRYTISTNQWGADSSGRQLLYLSAGLDDRDNVTGFSATWNWAASPQKVHAYPNVQLNDRAIPLPVNRLGALNVDVDWTLVEGTYNEGKKGTEALKQTGVVANVAFDFFLDPNPIKANSTTEPAYEIMIWVGRVGDVHPIGYSGSSSPVATQHLGGAEFWLYTGPNDHGQQVFSWLCTKNLASFKADVSPLVHYLWRHNLMDPSSRLGVVQFGTETIHTAEKRDVTFNATRVSMDLEPGEPKAASSGTDSTRARVHTFATAALASIVVFWTMVF